MSLRPTMGRTHNLNHHQAQLPRRGNNNDQPARPRSKPAHPPPATTPINPQLPAQQQARSLQHPQLASMMINTRSPLNSMRNFMNVLRRIQRPSTRSSRDDKQAINAQQPAQLSVLHWPASRRTTRSALLNNQHTDSRVPHRRTTPSSQLNDRRIPRRLPR